MISIYQNTSTSLRRTDTMIDNVELGKRIRERRKQRGLTQKALADILHVDKQAVSNWERGCNRPAEEIKEALQKELHIDFNVPLTTYYQKETTSMSIKELTSYNDISELRSAVLSIIDKIEIDPLFSASIKKMLKLTCDLLLSYELYYLPRTIPKDEEYELEWSCLASDLENILNEDELPGKPLGTYKTTFAKAVSAYCFIIGYELFEDFEPGSRFDREVGIYGHEKGYNLYAKKEL